MSDTHVTSYSFLNVQSYARQLYRPLRTAALGMYFVVIQKDLVGYTMISRLNNENKNPEEAPYGMSLDVT